MYRRYPSFPVLHISMMALWMSLVCDVCATFFISPPRCASSRLMGATSTNEKMCPSGFKKRRNCSSSAAAASSVTSSDRPEAFEDNPMAASFEIINRCRYACTRFRRHAEPERSSSSSQPKASISNRAIVRQALHCLNIARRAPSGFNSQPYKLLMVASKDAKEKLASCCHGRNAFRVRDSDCTVLFLADREWGRDMRRFGQLLDGGDETDNNSSSRRKWMKRKIQLMVLLFSSGYPLPRLLSVPLSFIVRFCIGLVGTITRRKVLVPTLTAAETWSTKNTMLVAMSYMLAATSCGLATCPMEGVWAQGCRRALGIPRRYAIPLIVSTGIPYHTPQASVSDNELVGTVENESDDVGMTHGSGPGVSTPRYPLDEVIFLDSFGDEAQLTATTEQ